MEELAEYLRGTCHSLDEAAELFGIDPVQALAKINEHDIEMCEQCNWWCDLSELNEEMICEDCRTDEEE